MRTANRSFQLEETTHGTFLLQGWLGGILTGFIYVIAICLWDQETTFNNALGLAPWFFITASILGVIKAILMWTPYRLAKFQPRAVTRVLITSAGTGLFAFGTGLIGYYNLTALVVWVLTLLMGGLPTAILVGSRVKPWELFTFGSIGGERRRSFWGTLGTLPLRFLSLLGFALWILYFALMFEPVEWKLMVLGGLIFQVPAAYLLFSAWVTFRSPDKAVLFVTGCPLNVLLTVLALYAYVKHTEAYDTNFYFYTSAICFSFVISWTVFLIARLSIRTDQSLSILGLSPRPHVEKRDHDCLGSRFVEWQERHAQ